MQAKTHASHHTGSNSGGARAYVVRYFALAASVLGCMAMQPARAQSRLEAAERCTMIDADASRLACYDRALMPRATRGAAAAAEETAPRPPRRSTNRNAAASPPSPPAPPEAPRAPAAAKAASSSSAEADAVMPIVVVEVQDVPGRGRVFTTADGHVWIQPNGQRSSYGDLPFRAEIRPGAFGSHFLVPTGRGRSVRVQPGD